MHRQIYVLYLDRLGEDELLQLNTHMRVREIETEEVKTVSTSFICMFACE
jgi:hypothetical protein